MASMTESRIRVWSHAGLGSADFNIFQNESTIAVIVIAFETSFVIVILEGRRLFTAESTITIFGVELFFANRGLETNRLHTLVQTESVQVVIFCVDSQWAGYFVRFERTQHNLH